VTNSSEDPQDGAYHQQDNPDGPQYGNSSHKSDDKQDDTEDDHQPLQSQTDIFNYAPLYDSGLDVIQWSNRFCYEVIALAESEAAGALSQRDAGCVQGSGVRVRPDPGVCSGMGMRSA
jgi:hypothetical protein